MNDTFLFYNAHTHIKLGAQNQMKWILIWFNTGFCVKCFSRLCALKFPINCAYSGVCVSVNMDRIRSGCVIMFNSKSRTQYEKTGKQDKNMKWNSDVCAVQWIERTSKQTSVEEFQADGSVKFPKRQKTNRAEKRSIINMHHFKRLIQWSTFHFISLFSFLLAI